jgi:hypothetical protein
VLAVHLSVLQQGLQLRFHGGLSGQKLKQVIDFITENYANEIKLAELAGCRNEQFSFCA